MDEIYWRIMVLDGGAEGNKYQKQTSARPAGGDPAAGAEASAPSPSNRSRIGHRSNDSSQGHTEAHRGLQAHTVAYSNNSGESIKRRESINSGESI